MLPKLKLLPAGQYRGVNEKDPIRYYYWPVFGTLYRRRVELALVECRGGDRILEIGFGTGLTFLNLAEMYREIHGLDLTADVPQVKSVFDALGLKTFLQNGNVLNMPYEDGYFDTVLLISILEHLKPEEQSQAFAEIKRVLKPGGQVVYGVPVERPLMVFLFRVLGHDIRQEHFSTEKQVAAAAAAVLHKVRIVEMKSMLPFLGKVYEVGHFVKTGR
ncbi:MAG: class I SAM-dependent methyltransferase [Candidatus Villigracilaceae bacterium]